MLGKMCWGSFSHQSYCISEAILNSKCNFAPQYSNACKVELQKKI